MRKQGKPALCGWLGGMAVALSLAASPAWALQGWVAQEKLELPPGHTLTYELLVTARSAPGESLVAFLSRLGGPMRQWSQQSGMELCSAIGRDPQTGQYGVVLGTNRSHIGCTIVPSQVPSGMQATGESVHTHGNGAAFKANMADRLMMGGSAPRGQPVLRGRVLNHFSATDRQTGPGYLVTPTGVLYQDGHGGPETAAIP